MFLSSGWLSSVLQQADSKGLSCRRVLVKLAVAALKARLLREPHTLKLNRPEIRPKHPEHQGKPRNWLNANIKKKGQQKKT